MLDVNSGHIATIVRYIQLYTHIMRVAIRCKKNFEYIRSISYGNVQFLIVDVIALSGLNIKD